MARSFASRLKVVAPSATLEVAARAAEMRARGIASQCVPLDYPGCHKHWRPKGIATGLNEQRLVQIVTGARPC